MASFNYVHQQTYVKQDISNYEIAILRHEETMMYPKVHFPREANLSWSGVATQRSPNSHK
jgi:hypothetical protein